MIDPTPEEECCGPVQVVVGVTPKGLITATQQFGAGTFAPQTLAAALKVGVLKYSPEEKDEQ